MCRRGFSQVLDWISNGFGTYFYNLFANHLRASSHHFTINHTGTFQVFWGLVPISYSKLLPKQNSNVEAWNCQNYFETNECAAHTRVYIADHFSMPSSRLRLLHVSVSNDIQLSVFMLPAPKAKWNVFKNIAATRRNGLRGIINWSTNAMPIIKHRAFYERGLMWKPTLPFTYACLQTDFVYPHGDFVYYIFVSALCDRFPAQNVRWIWNEDISNTRRKR